MSIPKAVPEARHIEAVEAGGEGGAHQGEGVGGEGGARHVQLLQLAALAGYF